MKKKIRLIGVSLAAWALATASAPISANELEPIEVETDADIEQPEAEAEEVFVLGSIFEEDLTGVDLIYYNMGDHYYISNDAGTIIEQIPTKNEKMYICAEVGLNFRYFPNSQYNNIVMSLPYGQEVEVIGEANGWSLVNCDEEVLYCRTEFLSAEVPPQLEKEVATSLGIFRLTAYCKCSSCCGKWANVPGTASGVMPTAGRTIACGILPFGTEVSINGHRYVVEDRGVKGNTIDIFFNSHEEALSFGQHYAEVFVIVK